jgi:menaquinone-dependent protoporphyrinogen oxidase
VPNALIVYATTHGHTARVAARLAGALDRAGVTAHIFDVRAIPATVTPRDFEAVVVAASVHHGSHQREIVEWAAEHHMSLGLRPTAFVSVSLSAADDAAEARADARRCVDRFVEDTDWTPSVTSCVAGAIRSSKYDVATRVLIRLVARRYGKGADGLEYEDFTDWDAVERFGRAFAAIVLRTGAAV